MSTDSTLDALGPLARALHARGFELFVAVRIAWPTELNFPVAQEIRALTNFGVKQITDAIVQRQIIFDSLTVAQAEHVSNRLAAVGAHSELSLARACRYAFLPKHPLRGAQTCERLTVVGHELSLAQGQLGAWTQASERPLVVGEDVMLAAIDRQRATWAAGNWREAGSELEILQSVSVRDEVLEARIRAAEGEALAHEAAVYGDWLQARGDARGHVGGAASRLDASREKAERAQAADVFAQLVAEHAGHLFGPLRPLLYREASTVRWIGPMISSVKLGEWFGSEFQHLLLLESLLALPACAGLRKLEIGHEFAGRADLGELLARSNIASSLRYLSLSRAFRLPLADARFERLEQLRLVGYQLQLGTISVPALMRLTIDLAQPPWQLASQLAGLDAPPLEHFDFAVYADDDWDQAEGPLHRQLGMILELPVFAQLRSLTLRSRKYSLPYEAGLARVLSQAPAIETLERIHLKEALLSPEARDELEAMQGGPRLLLP